MSAGRGSPRQQCGDLGCFGGKPLVASFYGVSGFLEAIPVVWGIHIPANVGVSVSCGMPSMWGKGGAVCRAPLLVSSASPSVCVVSWHGGCCCGGVFCPGLGWSGVSRHSPVRGIFAHSGGISVVYLEVRNFMNIDEIRNVRKVSGFCVIGWHLWVVSQYAGVSFGQEDYH